MGRPQELTEAERQRLRAEGYKPVELWVLDLDNPNVLESLRRECEAINESDLKNGELEYLDEVASDLWDDLPG